MSALAAVLMLVVSAEPDEAARLYEEGARHYQVEEYEPAIEAFKRSYVLSKNAGALYNIAQSYRFMGKCRDALRYYKTYLAEKPKAADRANVEALVTKMTECAEKEPKPPDPVAPAPAPVAAPQLVEPAPAPAPAPEAPRTRWAPWVLSITGVAIAGAGVGLNVRERLHFASLQQQCPCAESAWSAEPALERLSWGLAITGAVFLVAGVLWLLLGSP